MRIQQEEREKEAARQQAAIEARRKEIEEERKKEAKERARKIELDNQRKIEEFTFEFLDKMVKQNKSPEEIMIARNILLNGVSNTNLVNLYEYNTPTPTTNC